jgi:DNA-binding beta-propeller fold protein YncE
VPGVIEVDLDTGDRTPVTGGIIGFGEGPQLDQPQSITLDPANNRALIADQGLQAVMAFDLDTGDRTLHSDNSDQLYPQFGRLEGIAMDASHNRVLVVSGSSPKLLAVNLDTGERSEVTEQGLWNAAAPIELLLDEAAGRVILADFHLRSLLSLDPSRGEMAHFSRGQTGEGRSFSGPDAIAHDPDRNQVLFVNSTKHALVRVDLTDGGRSRFSTYGSGPEFKYPRDMVVDRANNRALVSNYSGAEVLEINLDNGDRAVMSGGTTAAGPALDSPAQLALDEAGGRVLVIDHGLDDIVAVDLATGDRSVVYEASLNLSSFSEPGAIAYDRPNNRILLIGGGELHALNLDSGTRSILSDYNTGNGPAFSGAYAVAYGLEPGHAIVKQYKSLMRVDLANGNRTLISGEGKGDGPVFLDAELFVLDRNGQRAFVFDRLRRALMVTNLDPAVDHDRAIASE